MRIGIDIGGTFNDVILMDGARPMPPIWLTLGRLRELWQQPILPTSSAARYPRSK
jgi:hypothetical protein